ncbi:MAG: branched-chain amino acid transport system ATP-binding protein [Gammaproteobacteria bacterium]|jgi:branched-chain amino acid transport system ATP-binding protein
MLEVNDLSCGYGDVIVARNLSFSVKQGELLSLIGANGAGKSSTLNCLCGLVEKKAGSIKIDSVEISEVIPERRIHHGIALVPEGRRVFPDLNVNENLTVGGHIVNSGNLEAGRETVFNYFPRLRERQNQLAGLLSGGEQQMLAFGRALMSQPRLLLVDEMSLGLMPKVVDECYQVLADLRNKNVAIILVEQNTERAIAVADQVIIIEAGNLLWQGSAEKVEQDRSILDTMLGK